MEKLLSLLKENARYSVKELSVLLNQSEDVVEAAIKAYETQGVLKGYTTIIDESKIDEAPVYALIELKVAPKKEAGFQDIADRVMSMEEVESVYLMAGVYDLAVFVKGKTMHDVAMFVAKRLSTLDDVLSTATHFVLSKYKESGFILDDKKDIDPRVELSKE